MLLGFIERDKEHIQHLLTEKQDTFAFARNVGGCSGNRVFRRYPGGTLEFSIAFKFSVSQTNK